MKQRLVSVDKFYDNPLTVRKLALSTEYTNNISKNSFLTEEAINKFSYILQQDLVCLENSGHFLTAYANTPIDPINALPNVDWVALVYLNFPSQAEGQRSLSLYIHKQLNCETLPNIEEQRVQGWNNLEEMYEGFVALEGQQEELWQTWYTAFLRYNRAIIFDAKLWHRQLQGFGDTINNCRLCQLFYFRNR